MSLRTLQSWNQEPWTLFDRLQQELHREGSSATSDWAPRVDIEEQSDRFVLRADLPGIDPEKVDITLEDGVLTISGERNDEKVSEDGTVKRRERVLGRFYRRFVLPDTTSADDVSASSSHGVVEIVIPKAEKAKPRRVQIVASNPSLSQDTGSQTEAA